MKREILKILRNSQQHVSGQELCDRLGVSRTAIWKIMNQLKEEGYVIDSVSNKGYKITAYPDVITPGEVGSQLKTQWLGSRLECFSEVDSTNNKVKMLAEQGAAQGTVVLSEIQTAGKGRRGRQWTSPAGTGIWMSFLLKPDIPPANASMLTLVSALAVAKVLNKEGLNSQIKWPNDIVLDGRKVCGILTEMSTELDYINYVVPGIGINVNMKSFPEEIAQVATSMVIERQKACKDQEPFHRSTLIAQVLEAFEDYYQQFLETGDLSQLVEEYNRQLVNIGRQVCIIEAKKEYTGTALGINPKGELLVNVDGQVHTVLAGEVSVRGILGYV